MKLIEVLKKREFYRLRRYRIYPNLLRDYVKRPGGVNIFQVFSIHRKGFTVSDWKLLGLTNDNYKNYLTTKRYYSYHPLNGYYSKLIDDKMVIKYVFSGTKVAPYTPDYFFMIDEEGLVKPLMDWSEEKSAYAPEDITQLLMEKGMLAVKLVTGSIGKGFYKAEYADNTFFVNGEKMDRAEFEHFLGGLRNYIISEYLRPHPVLAQIWPDTANTMRFLACRVDGDLHMLKSFVRFGSKKSGVVENFNRGGVLCYVREDGSFQGGYIIDRRKKVLRTVQVDRHPDTDQLLEGQIPCWEDVNAAVQEIGRLLPQTKYLGFDFVITHDNKAKLLEINSLTSMDSLQLDCSILDLPIGRQFFDSMKEA